MKNIEKFYPLQKGDKNPILRKISQKIEKIDDDILQFGKDLIELMWTYEGVGLAAPQVGENIRIIATTQRIGKGKKMKMESETIMINPEIIEKSDEMIISNEACLSLPGMSGDVKRYKSIKVEYTGIDNKKYKKKYKNFDAFIIQHECDHLDGVLFIDKLYQKN